MSSTIEIRTVLSRKDRRRFLLFPYQLYRNDSNWVPPLIADQKVLLNPGKNPFFKHADAQFFLALGDGQPMGRVAAMVDHKHNEIHSEKTGFFGFFECLDNREAANALLTAARDWVKDRGMTAFRGPVNPSQNEDCGLLTDAFNLPPVLMMTYNPPYYPALLTDFGLEKVMDLYAYYIDDSNPPPEKLVRVAEIVRKRKRLRIRPINMKHFDDEAKKVWFIYNNAWFQNWGFVPMTEDEFAHLAKKLKQGAVPDLALIAEVDGKPVGFSLSMPDLNQAIIHARGRLFPFGLLKILHYAKKIDMIRIITMGVIKEYRNMGIDAVFYLDTWRNATKRGYHRGEMSWILENNVMMNRSAEMLGGKIYKTYRMYEMKV
jgi:GNAT superfamily N-acetyltransferase